MAQTLVPTSDVATPAVWTSTGGNFWDEINQTIASANDSLLITAGQLTFPPDAELDFFECHINVRVNTNLVHYHFALPNVFQVCVLHHLHF